MVNNYSKAACSILRSMAAETAELAKYITDISAEAGDDIDQEVMDVGEYYESYRKDICSGDNEALAAFTHYAMATNKDFINGLVRESFLKEVEFRDIFTEDYEGDQDPLDP